MKDSVLYMHVAQTWAQESKGNGRVSLSHEYLETNQIWMGEKEDIDTMDSI
jgi:hypothetical protein